MFIELQVKFTTQSIVNFTLTFNEENQNCNCFVLVLIDERTEIKLKSKIFFVLYTKNHSELGKYIPYCTRYRVLAITYVISLVKKNIVLSYCSVSSSYWMIIIIIIKVIKVFIEFFHVSMTTEAKRIFRIF